MKAALLCPERLGRDGLGVFELGEAEGIADFFVEVHPDSVGMRQEDLDYAGVELFAGVAFDFCASGGNRERFAIRAIGNHGVESVGDRENSGADGNLLAAEAARIAGAVEAFLVRQHDFCRFLEEGNAFQHGETDFAVLAHHVTLFGGQGTGLAQDAIWNAHLANVVEECAARDVTQQAFIHAHGARNRDGESGDALAVTFGFGVFGIEGAAESFESVVVGLFEILQSDG